MESSKSQKLDNNQSSREYDLSEALLSELVSILIKEAETKQSDKLTNNESTIVKRPHYNPRFPHIKEIVDIVFVDSENAKRFVDCLKKIGMDNLGMPGSPRKMTIKSVNQSDRYVVNLLIEEFSALGLQMPPEQKTIETKESSNDGKSELVPKVKSILKNTQPSEEPKNPTKNSKTAVTFNLHEGETPSKVQREPESSQPAKEYAYPTKDTSEREPSQSTKADDNDVPDLTGDKLSVYELNRQIVEPYSYPVNIRYPVKYDGTETFLNNINLVSKKKDENPKKITLREQLLSRPEKKTLSPREYYFELKVFGNKCILYNMMPEDIYSVYQTLLDHQNVTEIEIVPSQSEEWKKQFVKKGFEVLDRWLAQNPQITGVSFPTLDCMNWVSGHVKNILKNMTTIEIVGDARDYNYLFKFLQLLETSKKIENLRIKNILLDDHCLEKLTMFLDKNSLKSLTISTDDKINICLHHDDNTFNDFLMSLLSNDSLEILNIDSRIFSYKQSGFFLEAQDLRNATKGQTEIPQVSNEPSPWEFILANLEKIPDPDEDGLVNVDDIPEIMLHVLNKYVPPYLYATKELVRYFCEFQLSDDKKKFWENVYELKDNQIDDFLKLPREIVPQHIQTKEQLKIFALGNIVTQHPNSYKHWLQLFLSASKGPLNDLNALPSEFFLVHQEIDYGVPEGMIFEFIKKEALHSNDLVLEYIHKQAFDNIAQKIKEYWPVLPSFFFEFLGDIEKHNNEILFNLYPQCIESAKLTAQLYSDFLKSKPSNNIDVKKLRKDLLQNASIKDYFIEPFNEIFSKTPLEDILDGEFCNVSFENEEDAQRFIKSLTKIFKDTERNILRQKVVKDKNIQDVYRVQVTSDELKALKSPKIEMLEKLNKEASLDRKIQDLLKEEQENLALVKSLELLNQDRELSIYEMLEKMNKNARNLSETTAWFKIHRQTLNLPKKSCEIIPGADIDKALLFYSLCPGDFDSFVLFNYPDNIETHFNDMLYQTKNPLKNIKATNIVTFIYGFSTAKEITELSLDPDSKHDLAYKWVYLGRCMLKGFNVLGLPQDFDSQDRVLLESLPAEKHEMYGNVFCILKAYAYFCMAKSEKQAIDCLNEIATYISDGIQLNVFYILIQTFTSESQEKLKQHLKFEITEQLSLENHEAKYVRLNTQYRTLKSSIQASKLYETLPSKTNSLTSTIIEYLENKLGVKPQYSYSKQNFICIFDFASNYNEAEECYLIADNNRDKRFLEELVKILNGAAGLKLKFSNHQLRFTLSRLDLTDGELSSLYEKLDAFFDEIFINSIVTKKEIAELFEAFQFGFESQWDPKTLTFSIMFSKNRSSVIKTIFTTIDNEEIQFTENALIDALRFLGKYLKNESDFNKFIKFENGNLVISMKHFENILGNDFENLENVIQHKFIKFTESVKPKKEVAISKGGNEQVSSTKPNTKIKNIKQNLQTQAPQDKISNLIQKFETIFAKNGVAFKYINFFVELETEDKIKLTQISNLLKGIFQKRNENIKFIKETNKTYTKIKFKITNNGLTTLLEDGAFNRNLEELFKKLKVQPVTSKDQKGGVEANQNANPTADQIQIITDKDIEELMSQLKKLSPDTSWDEKSKKFSMNYAPFYNQKINKFVVKLLKNNYCLDHAFLIDLVARFKSIFKAVSTETEEIVIFKDAAIIIDFSSIKPLTKENAERLNHYILKLSEKLQPYLEKSESSKKQEEKTDDVVSIVKKPAEEKEIDKRIYFPLVKDWLKLILNLDPSSGVFSKYEVKNQKNRYKFYINRTEFDNQFYIKTKIGNEEKQFTLDLKEFFLELRQIVGFYFGFEKSAPFNIFLKDNLKLVISASEAFLEAFKQYTLKPQDEFNADIALKIKEIHKDLNAMLSLKHKVELEKQALIHQNEKEAIKEKERETERARKEKEIILALTDCLNGKFKKVPNSENEYGIDLKKLSKNTDAIDEIVVGLFIYGIPGRLLKNNTFIFNVTEFDDPEFSNIYQVLKPIIDKDLTEITQPVLQLVKAKKPKIKIESEKIPEAMFLIEKIRSRTHKLRVFFRFIQKNDPQESIKVKELNDKSKAAYIIFLTTRIFVALERLAMLTHTVYLDDIKKWRLYSAHYNSNDGNDLDLYIKFINTLHEKVISKFNFSKVDDPTAFLHQFHGAKLHEGDLFKALEKRFKDFRRNVISEQHIQKIIIENLKKAAELSMLTRTFAAKSMVKNALMHYISVAGEYMNVYADDYKDKWKAILDANTNPQRLQDIRFTRNKAYHEPGKLKLIYSINKLSRLGFLAKTQLFTNTETLTTKPTPTKK